MTRVSKMPFCSNCGAKMEEAPAETPAVEVAEAPETPAEESAEE